MPTLIEIIDDYRLRTWNDHYLVGDYIPLADGTTGVIIALRKHGNQYSIVAVPRQFVDRKPFLKDYLIPAFPRAVDAWKSLLPKQ